MRFLTWNIQGGGGTRISSIVDEIADLQPDLVGLTEVRFGNLESLCRALGLRGYDHVETSCSTGSKNSVLVASKFALSVVDDPVAHDPERWLPVEIDGLDLKVLCVHIPGGTDHKFDADGVGMSGKKRKELLWDEVIRFARQHRDEKVVILGDFNTGLPEDAQGTPFVLSDCMRVLHRENYVDSWRSLHPDVREFTWYTKRKNKETSISEDHNGFRLDYVFVSPKLGDGIVDARHIHEVRRKNVSDHAIVMTDLTINSSGPTMRAEPQRLEPSTTAPTPDAVQPAGPSPAALIPADGPSDSLFSALSKARIPAENHGFIRRFTTAIGIAEFSAASDVSKPYVIARRRDGGRELRIYSGYTTGFTSLDEIARLFGAGAGRNNNSPKGTWWVEHPKNKVRPGGGSPRSVKREASLCGRCGMQLPLTGVCGYCT